MFIYDVRSYCKPLSLFVSLPHPHYLAVLFPLPPPHPSHVRLSNEFPEADIDAVRAEKDIALQRYILEADRKEALLLKMYSEAAPSSSSSSSNQRQAKADTAHDDDASSAATGGKLSSRSEAAESKQGGRKKAEEVGRRHMEISLK